MDIKRLIQNIRYNLHMSSLGRGGVSRKIFKSVGDNVRLPTMIMPLYPELVSIGNNVEVASGVRFVVHDAIHEVINNDGHSGVTVEENKGEIIIGDNVFIGAGAIILPGVKIGSNVIVGAGSVINKDLPDNSVCVGVPCKVIGTYDGYVKAIENRK
ncbi:MAG: acyltransferase [Clostridiales bacterium]|nr:acyltransferase [Clostridiales bacterium]